MKTEKSYVVKEGLQIPWIFFGTGIINKYTRKPSLWVKTNIRQLLSSVKHRKMNRELYINLHISQILNDAYEMGFRGFDTARIYGFSEKKIGKINAKYDDIWINTKCSMMDIERNASPSSLSGNLRISNRNLQTDTVNCLLLHWPEGNGWLDVYADIVEEYKKHHCDTFGICNVTIEDLLKIQNNHLQMPMIIQNEIHPLNTQVEMREFCKNHNIQLMAHTPTARMCDSIKNNEVLNSLARKYKKSLAQIIIRWHYQNDIIPIVSTIQKKHMKEDLDIFDFELTKDEMISIDEQNVNLYLITTRGIDDPNYIYNL